MEIHLVRELEGSVQFGRQSSDQLDGMGMHLNIGFEKRLERFEIEQYTIIQIISALRKAYKNCKQVECEPGDRISRTLMHHVYFSALRGCVNVRAERWAKVPFGQYLTILNGFSGNYLIMVRSRNKT